MSSQTVYTVYKNTRNFLGHQASYFSARVPLTEGRQRSWLPSGLIGVASNAVNFFRLNPKPRERLVEGDGRCSYETPEELAEGVVKDRVSREVPLDCGVIFRRATDGKIGEGYTKMIGVGVPNSGLIDQSSTVSDEELLRLSVAYRDFVEERVRSAKEVVRKVRGAETVLSR